ncbi:hypothetical protein C3L33_22412, partial [Rhododendron williamsianum]
FASSRGLQHFGASMEHDSVQLTHNGEGIDDTSMDQVLSQDSFDEFSVWGDREVIPRVGDQYQVEIPQLMTESEYLLYSKDPFEEGCVDFVPCDFLIGLPIPITRINTEVRSMKQKGKKFLGDPNGKLNKNRQSEAHSSKATGLTLKVEDSNHSADSGDSNNLTLEREMKRQMHQKYGGEGYCLVPGSCGSSWSDIEEASFLLGLYIFGKNLVQVRRFIDTKTMGDILSHYYGKFYKSNEYLRWSDCRKLRSKRCAYGPRIFTGLRQQELLSRLCLHVSEACQNTMLEVSKKFGEGKVSLEEYVSTLKSTVGMKSLVEAVGIGKRKRDLTGIALETSKYNRVNPTHPEVPIGKAWSSLSPSEITKFLAGDSRLSKARSSDLFWESIWPRLLARGWHSEQPRDTEAGYIDSLVFLMPGVKKFSRKRLEKGNHYFDCVADVLKRVASDPSLLELDTDADERNGNNETIERSLDTKLERPSYLKARTPNRNSDLMKLTVVDTSLKNGKLFKVRELKTSPFEVTKKTASRSHFEEHNTMFFDQKDINGSNLKNMSSAIGDLPTEKYLEMGNSDRGVPIKTSYFVNACIKSSKACKSSGDDKPRKPLKCGRRVKESSLSFLVPLTKRRRKLLPGTQSELSHCLLSSSVSLSLGQEKNCSSEKSLYGLDSTQEQVSSTISSRGSATEVHDGVFCPKEKTESPTLIDLNLPQVSPYSETAEGSVVELRNGGDDQSSKIPQNSSAPVPSADLTGNFRRQGTRNRPPTARALEALANGFLTTNRRRKHKESFSRKSSTATPQVYKNEQDMLGEMVVNGNFGTGTVAS